MIVSKVAYVKGDTVNLTCISAGYPTVLFKWTKDNKFFSLKHQLTIQNVDVKDEAIYECQVTNNIEAKSSFFSLKLICEFIFVLLSYIIIKLFLIVLMNLFLRMIS